MRTTKMVLGLNLLAALLAFPALAMAEETVYDAYNISIQPGSNETELNFTWFTETEPAAPELLIGESASRLGHKKRAHQERYSAACELVEVETQAAGFDPVSAQEETTTETEETDVYSCKASVTGLRNNSHYSYAVGDADLFTETYYFDTENSKNFNFIFVGDPQIGASRDTDSDKAGWDDTVTDAIAMFPRTSFILSAGDQVESSTSDSQYTAFLEVEDLASVPFAPAIGNHDTSDLYGYHFNVPNESELGTTSGGGDYWFTYGNTLFMVLNTNNASATAHDTFLAQAIEENPTAKWRVVVFHHSIYSSARHVDDVNDLRTSMYPVIDSYDIDVVLAGHDHFYARTYQLSGGDSVDETCYTSTGRDGQEQTTCVDLIGDTLDSEDDNRKQYGALNPQGTVYITANSASGSKYYDFTNIDGYTNYYLAAYDQPEAPTFLNLKVNEAILTIEAYNTDTGEMFDSYRIIKTQKRNKGHHFSSYQHGR